MKKKVILLQNDFKLFLWYASFSFISPFSTYAIWKEHDTDRYTWFFVGDRIESTTHTRRGRSHLWCWLPLVIARTSDYSFATGCSFPKREIIPYGRYGDVRGIIPTFLTTSGDYRLTNCKHRFTRKANTVKEVVRNRSTLF